MTDKGAQCFIEALKNPHCPPDLKLNIRPLSVFSDQVQKEWSEALELYFWNMAHKALLLMKGAKDNSFHLVSYLEALLLT